LGIEEIIGIMPKPVFKPRGPHKKKNLKPIETQAERSGSMKSHTKFVFALSALFLVFFLFGVTDKGQEVLRGRIPANASPMDLDDIYMASGLAPWCWGLIPSALACILGLILRRADLRARNRNSN
jgi:hypothetical protein